MMKKFYVGLALLVVALVAGCTTEPPPAGPTLEEGREAAEDFVRNGATFAFDGMDGTLRLANTVETSPPNSWTFVFEFDSSHAGYGDRTGRMLAQVITRHVASVTVEQGEVVHASLDDEWDMLKQAELSGDVDHDSAVVKPADFTGRPTDVNAVDKTGVLGVLMVESQVEKVVDKQVRDHGHR